MTFQMKQTPDAASALLIEPDHMGPPVAPLAMPKQILTREPGHMRRVLGHLQSWFSPGRNGLRRTA